MSEQSQRLFSELMELLDNPESAGIKVIKDPFGKNDECSYKVEYKDLTLWVSYKYESRTGYEGDTVGYEQIAFSVIGITLELSAGDKSALYNKIVNVHNIYVKRVNEHRLSKLSFKE